MSNLIRFIVFIIFLAIVIIGTVFSNHNATEVPLWLGIDLAPQRISVWIIISFSFGGLLGLLLGFGLFKRIKHRVQISSLQKKLKIAEKQLADLKVGPSGDSD